MDDQYYRRIPHRNWFGGYTLHAVALAPRIPPYYPGDWWCDHLHEPAEEALACPQYENELLAQVRRCSPA